MNIRKFFEFLAWCEKIVWPFPDNQCIEDSLDDFDAIVKEYMAEVMPVNPVELYGVHINSRAEYNRNLLSSAAISLFIKNNLIPIGYGPNGDAVVLNHLGNVLIIDHNQFWRLDEKFTLDAVIFQWDNLIEFFSSISKKMTPKRLKEFKIKFEEKGSGYNGAQLSP